MSALPIELPQVLAINLSKTKPGWKQQPHDHDCHEICYVHAGRGWLRAGGRDTPIQRGSMYLFLPGEPHGGWNGDEPLQILFIAIRFPRSAPVVREQSALPFFLTGAAAATLRPSLRALAEILDRHPRVDHSAALPDSALPHILGVLAGMVEPVGELERVSSRQRDLAIKTLSMLEHCAEKPPTLSALAKCLQVSADHLGEVLRLATGRRYPDLVAQQRVRTARALLADEGMPVREVAKRVGLSGPRALARLFRRITGKAPSSFRDS
jgi:AraC-like DNA-binding protein/quercetin dioxygenase-like cupin family protein